MAAKAASSSDTMMPLMRPNPAMYLGRGRFGEIKPGERLLARPSRGHNTTDRRRGVIRTPRAVFRGGYPCLIPNGPLTTLKAVWREGVIRTPRAVFRGGYPVLAEPLR